jgi:hypothetical protein
LVLKRLNYRYFLISLIVRLGIVFLTSSNYLCLFEMVKLIVGNLVSDVSVNELRSIFEEYGIVTECDIIKSFGIVVSATLLEFVTVM